MDLKKDFRVELKKYPTNLYRDDKMKTAINHFLKKQKLQILKNNKNTKQTLQNQANLSLQAAVMNGNSNVKVENEVSLAETRQEMMSQYPFVKQPKTLTLSVAEIVEKEQGKKGLEEMQRKLKHSNDD